jgi:nicotinamidase-related amidase
MLPELHPQWRSLNFKSLFADGAAFVNTDAQNSILDPDGVLRHEKIWRGAREQGGSLHNILRLAGACRPHAMPFLWLRYDRFIGERQPVTEMDAAQYRFWNETYTGDDARKAWEADLVPEVKEVMQPDDIILIYPAWSIFTGTPIERWLRQWGTRTLILSGYHTDWCVEMAARTARELGFMPVVVGDACGTTQPLHDQTLAQINDCYAPVISTREAIDALG